ncbi:MAG: MBL fold metallo-hydrolase [Chloroflexota bacterium]
MQQIERGIYFEDAYLGVTLGALVYPHGTIMVDAPLRSEDARSWRSALINQRGGPNRLLVSMDAHPDRTLGTRALDCTIIAHQKTAQVFRNRPTVFKGQSMETGSDWETYAEAVGMRWAAPDITFSERMTLHWGNGEVILEHRPGPTPGSIWIIVPEVRVVFVGDAVVQSQAPFLAYADLDAWIESLDVLVKAYRDYTIIGGRGGPIASADVKAQQRILKDVVAGMEKLARKGVTPEGTEVLSAPLLTKCKVAPEMRERSARRLKHGLYHCFARRYHSESALGPVETESEEQ